jgi:dipeptidyl-peptidase 4
MDRSSLLQSEDGACRLRNGLVGCTTRAAPPRSRARPPHAPLILLLFLAGCWALAEPPEHEPDLLTLDRIFDSTELDPTSAGPFQWHPAGLGYTALEPPAGGGSGRDLVVYDPETGRRDVLVPAHAWVPRGESAPLTLEDYQFATNGARVLVGTQSKRVWRTRSRKDYWVLEVASRELRQLGGTAPPSTLRFAQFSPDGRRVAYVQQNNLFVQDLSDLRITALTTNGSETLINGTFDWVYEEELGLHRGFRWSPDSRRIAYWQLDTSGVGIFHLIDNTAGLYPRLAPIAYPKAGELNASARVGVVPAEGGDTRWIEVPGDPREHYLARMDWSGPEIALQQFNRLQNTNRVFLAHPETGRVRQLLVETDRAWVENANEFRWIDRERSLLWLSERSGWRHLYQISRSGKRVRRITRGEFDVIRLVAVDEEGRRAYFLASPDDPTRQYLYRARLRGGGIERVTPPGQTGVHQYNVAPDGRWALHTVSAFDRPPTTTLIRWPTHEPVRTLADNTALSEKLASLRATPLDFFRVEIGDGVKLDGWCLTPPDFDPALRYPVLFFVYGEPAGQTVLDRWGGKRRLWHTMLAQQGYVVISVDNRGTPAPRGREWRKSIYRQVGILASADQAAAVRALLRERPYLDATRVAIWGWSGGGSMTLNAIFRYPDLYQTAMAVAPVPNLRLYDTIYQERYMGLPSDNAEGYRLGSPLAHAHQLQGQLLLVHGTGDDNVHYQGTEQLVDELIAHAKRFTLMAYPNRTHSISEGRNTPRHLHDLLTRFLHAHTPPGPAAGAEGSP